MPKKPTPELKCLLLADSMFRQAGEGGPGKYCLVGIFDTIYATTFPAVHQELCLYFCIANAHGDYDIRIRIVDEMFSEVGRLEGIQFRAKDRLRSPGLGIRVRGLPLLRAGKYFVKVDFDGVEATGDATFFVKAAPRSKRSKNDD